MLPLYFIDPNLGYIRLLMLLEYEDMIFLCQQIVYYTFWFVQSRLLKHIAIKMFGTFLILTVYILLFSHVSACVFLLSERGAFSTNGIVLDPISDYITALYFMVTTSTSVGYGDKTINHFDQHLVFLRYLYQIFLMLVSIVINSAFYSGINMTVNDTIYMLEKMQEPLEEFDLWLASRMRWMGRNYAVNKFYKINTTNFNFMYNFDLTLWVRYLKFMDQIPFAWSEQIIDHSCFDLKTKFEAYFEPLPIGLDEKLIFAMKPMTFLKGDLITERRERFGGLYFVVDGKIRVYFRTTANTVYFLGNGDDFGDGCLVGRNSHFSYLCETDVLAMFVALPVLDDLLAEYKATREFLVWRANLRHRKCKNIATRIASMRARLNPARRRQALQTLDSPLLARPVQLAPLQLLNCMVPKEESSNNNNIAGSRSSSSSSSSKGSSKKAVPEKNAEKRKQLENFSKQPDHSLPPITPKKKEPSKHSILSKVVPVSNNIQLQNRIIRLKSTDLAVKKFTVSKDLNMAEIVDRYSQVKDPEIAPRDFDTPFLRLHQGLLATGARGQTKLIRANSVDRDSKRQISKDVSTIMTVLTADVAKGQENQKRFVGHFNDQARLQKELILASSKTMARERVRDFALSLHKSILKEEYKAAAVRSQKHRVGKQKGAVGLQRILAPLLKEGGLDGSLADSTEEEVIVVARLYSG